MVLRSRFRLWRARLTKATVRRTRQEMARSERSVFLLPGRLRGTHLPPMSAGLDVPSLSERAGSRHELPGAFHGFHLFLRGRPHQCAQSHFFISVIGNPIGLQALGEWVVPQKVA